MRGVVFGQSQNHQHHTFSCSMESHAVDIVVTFNHTEYEPTIADEEILQKKSTEVITSYV